MKALTRPTIIHVMKITLNGETRQLPDDATTVAQLVEHLGLGDSPVAVEVNRDVVPRRQHDRHELHDGDTVEVVSLVGGG